MSPVPGLIVVNEPLIAGDSKPLFPTMFVWAAARPGECDDARDGDDDRTTIRAALANRRAFYDFHMQLPNPDRYV